MGLYLVFHRNLMSGEDFTTPVEAPDVESAIASLNSRYTQPAYLYLTCFEKKELQGILDDAERWPGVASKPQPTLEQMLQRVTAKVGKLPPMPGRKPAEQPAVQAHYATDARVEMVRSQPRPWGVGPVPLASVEAPVKKAITPKDEPSFSPANANRSVIDVLRALRS